MPHLVSPVAWLLFWACPALVCPAQSCLRPLPLAPGWPVRTEPTSTVTYSDGYATDGNLVLPDVPPPACGWPLVVYVHRLGANRLEEPAFRHMLAAQGYAVWSCDVRGQGSGLFLHPGNGQLPNRGTTLWGPIERHDLAEQVRFVADEPAWHGVVDAGRVAVMGPSQGGVHAWAAAALSGRELSLPGRDPVTFPVVRCVAAIDYVSEPVSDWLRDGGLWSMWFVNMIADDATHQGFLLDQAFWDEANARFEVQDQAGLLGYWTAEGRPIDDLLAVSQVPVLYSQAYHDLIDSPLLSLRALRSNAVAPRRVLLGTIGHNTPLNRIELAYRDQTIVRWMHRWLWNEPNAIEHEPAYVLAELPLDAAARNQLDHPWSRHHGGDPLQQVPATRLHLHADGSLQEVFAPQPPALLSIEQEILDPLFTADAYLASVGNRTLASVLAACPLSEVQYVGAPFAAEQVLTAAPRLHLRVVPEQPDWMIAAVLSVQLPAGPPYGGERVMLACWGQRRTGSVPGSPVDLDLELPPVATRIPPGASIVLSLRNLWLREPPMTPALEVAPVFAPFEVAVGHGSQNWASWIDLPLEAPRPALVCSEQFLDLATMRPLSLVMRGGLAAVGKPFFVSASASGQVPGTVYLGQSLPLNVDWLTVFVTNSFFTPQLQGFLGDLDAAGEGTAVLDLSAFAPLDPRLTGLRVTFAGFVWDHLFAPSGRASNAVDVFLR